MLEQRKQEWEAAQRSSFDVVIIGGGINGACLYHHLCAKGYRVLLADKGDFGSGSSQASAMMIWGGLLYLRNFDVAAVLKLCLCRDRMIGRMKDWIRPQTFRFMARREARSTIFVEMALYLYWLMGGFRRARPHAETDFSESSFLGIDKFRKALDYEEACVMPSDARFVLHWILACRNEQQIALNHCEVSGGSYDPGANQWHLQFNDSLLRKEAVVHSRLVVNAAGVWTDSVNRQFRIDSPYKHVFSKGVFVGMRRDPRHTVPLILDIGEKGDCMSLIPWGPVSLWGPTETLVHDLNEGFRVTSEDVDLLLSELNRNLACPAGPDGIVSFRCGIRPLAVKRSFNKDCYPLDLSRKFRIDRNPSLPWISLFGGKLTDCVPFAESVTRLIQKIVEPTGPLPDQATEQAITDRLAYPERATFPGLAEEVPSPSWCVENEVCWTLEDYLRRRTNIAQWVPRGGLGLHNENAAHLKAACRVFCFDDEDAAQEMLQRYQQKIGREFDDLIQPQRDGTPFPFLEEQKCCMRVP